MKLFISLEVVGKSTFSTVFRKKAQLQKKAHRNLHVCTAKVFREKRSNTAAERQDNLSQFASRRGFAIARV